MIPIALNQKQRLELELEQLTKTYKAGIITEAEFNKGKERIEGKLQSIMAAEAKEAESKKVIRDILESDTQAADAGADGSEADEGLQAEPVESAPEKTGHAQEEGQVPERHKPRPKKKVQPKVQPKKRHAKKKAAVKKSARKKQPAEPDEDSLFSRIIIVAGIICIIILLVLVKVFTGNTAAGQDTARDLTGVNTTVVMEAYLDFSCPYTPEAWETMLQLKKIYGDNLRIKVKHFPLSRDDLYVEHAIQCARDQRKQMQFIRRVLDNQDKLSKDTLKNYAWVEGLDALKFHACTDGLLHLDLVRDDFNEGYGRGVRASPTFFIDNEKVVGVQDIPYYQQVIDQKLGIRP